LSDRNHSTRGSITGSKLRDGVDPLADGAPSEQLYRWRVRAAVEVYLDRLGPEMRDRFLSIGIDLSGGNSD